jgi:hypothetical protein
MPVERDGQGSVRVLDGSTLIAEGTLLAGQPGDGSSGPVSNREARTGQSRRQM